MCIAPKMPLIAPESGEPIVASSVYVKIYHQTLLKLTASKYKTALCGCLLIRSCLQKGFDYIQTLFCLTAGAKTTKDDHIFNLSPENRL